MKSRSLLLMCTALITFALVLTGACAGISGGEIVEITSDDGGDDQSPQVCEYKDALYLVWVSTNPDLTTGTDADIVVDTYAGGSWGNPVELSSPDNSQADASPCSAVFGDKLYVAWSTNDDVDSTGDDWDIILRSYDGVSWSSVVEITSDDTGDDYSPQLCVFGDKLYIAWQTWDNSTSDGDDADIVLRSFDGNTWSHVPRPTAGDEGNDYSPRLAAFANQMYLVWTTEDKVADGMDSDIVARAFDGNQWDPTSEVTPDNDTGDDQHPFACSYNDRLYVIWQTPDDTTGTGKDDDIVLRWFDGTTWSDPLEMTSSEMLGHKDSGSDGFPFLIVFDGQLHAVWQTNDPVTSTGSDWDMVICTYNGDKWSRVTELTSTGDGGSDGGIYARGMDAAVYQNTMYVIWQTIDPSTSTGSDQDLVMRLYITDPETGQMSDNGDGDGDVGGSSPLTIWLIIGILAIISVSLIAVYRKKRG